MASADQKVLQYLDEVFASEQALTRVLESQIAVAPSGTLRDGLVTHLEETKKHAVWVAERLTELGQERKPVTGVVGLVETVAGQIIALSKTPLDLVRGTNLAEKVLKNTKDACATEALEIASYTAIEQLARSAGDPQTAALAGAIRAEEEAMLARLLAELPGVAQSVLDGTDNVAQTGAGEAVQKLADAADSTVHQAGTATQDAVAAIRGDEPWEGYDSLTVPKITAALDGADEALLNTVLTYEKAHKKRAGVLKAADRDLAAS
jgi:ferritin-like metal-binding protein YciE